MPSSIPGEGRIWWICDSASGWCSRNFSQSLWSLVGGILVCYYESHFFSPAPLFLMGRRLGLGAGNWEDNWEQLLLCFHLAMHPLFFLTPMINSYQALFITAYFYLSSAAASFITLWVPLSKPNEYLSIPWNKYWCIVIGQGDRLMFLDHAIDQYVFAHMVNNLFFEKIYVHYCLWSHHEFQSQWFHFHFLF